MKKARASKVVRTLKDKHLGSLAPLESSSSWEKGEESSVDGDDGADVGGAGGGSGVVRKG